MSAPSTPAAATGFGAEGLASGIRVHHRREGSGEPLVLLHGIGHHLQAYDQVVPELAREFDVVACDSPGFGQSPPLPERFGATIPDYVAAFTEWFAEQGIDRPHVVGNSMGGAIALELARAGVARSATAFSPAGFWTGAERTYTQLSLRLITAMPKAVHEPVVALARRPLGRTALTINLFGRPWRMSADEVEGTLRDAWAAPSFGAADRGFDEYEFRAEGFPDDVPVTVAWGSRDLLLPYALQFPRAKARLPRARHVTLHGMGHVPFTDDPGVCAAVIRKGTGRA